MEVVDHGLESRRQGLHLSLDKECPASVVGEFGQLHWRSQQQKPRKQKVQAVLHSGYPDHHISLGEMLESMLDHFPGNVHL